MPDDVPPVPSPGDTVAPAPAVADTAAPAPAVADTAAPAPAPIENQLSDLTKRVIALEDAQTVEHSQADPTSTLGAKVSKLFLTIFGSDD